MTDYSFRDTSLPLEERARALLSCLTLPEKLGMLTTHQHAVPRLDIDEWFIGTEIARGFVSRRSGEISTVFPQPIGLCSTFDVPLLEEIGAIAGTEARYYHRQSGKKTHLCVWGPTVDPLRDPRWGRTEEGYSEDPYLAGTMSAAYTRGLAGDDSTFRQTIPTLKHFCANNNENCRTTSSSNVTPRTLHEYYYRPFEIAIRTGGAGSMMTAYNELSGVPACMNPDLKHLVHDTWSLDYIITDGADFGQNVLDHRSHPTHAEAYAACLKNGCDIMVDNDKLVETAARDALDRGLIDEKDIDRALYGTLLARFRLGEFDPTDCPYATAPVAIDTPIHRAVNYTATCEQVCLLENNGTLPLNLSPTETLAVLGPLADENYRDWYAGKASYAVSIRDAITKRLGKERVFFDNGYDIVAIRSLATGKYITVRDDGTLSATADTIDARARFEWHAWDDNTYNFRALATGKYVIEDTTYKATSDTPYEWFIREEFHPEKVDNAVRFYSWHEKRHDIITAADGTLTTAPHLPCDNARLFEIIVLDSGTARLSRLAAQCDRTLLCVGNHPMQVAREGYDRAVLDLAPHQRALIDNIAPHSPILMIIASYPYVLSHAMRDNCPAILYSTHAGAELGNAIDATLFGENNPAARCPVTWYASATDLPAITDYDIIESNGTYLYNTATPLYPFGHGLSYSTFSYTNFTATQEKNSLHFSLTLKNTSTRDGDEVPQIYATQLSPRLKRPARWLIAFQRISIPAGQSVTLTLDTPLETLAYYDTLHETMRVDSGEYCFSVGASLRDIRADFTLAVEGDRDIPRDIKTPLLAKNYTQKEGYDTTLAFSYRQNDWYLRTCDWGGSLTWKGITLNGETCLSLTTAAPIAPAFVTLCFDDTPVSTVAISPAACEDDFTDYPITIPPHHGVHTITLKITGQLAIYALSIP